MRTSSTSRRRATRRGVIGLTALALVAAACGGSSDTTDTTAAPTSTAATTTTTTVARSTTTTAPAPTTTVKKTTTTTEAPEPVYPLTGIGDPDKGIMKLPALVVKIDNASGARPQTGFNSADIVYEEIVNDSLTRFAMVFHSRGSDVVGPIRSGRIQDVNLFGSYHGPLFAWSGGNATVTDAIRASDLIEIGPSRAYAAYYRASDRSIPHNLYSSTPALWMNTPPDAGPPPQQFRYRADGDRIQGEPATGVVLRLDSVDVEWTWDPATGLYSRVMDGVVHLDRGTGTAVTTNNVVVLVMNYANGISGSPDAESVGFGEAFVFSGGKYVIGTWVRKDRADPFTIRDHAGRRVLLTPGRTFIELPRAGFTLPITGS